jgi:hypothetical protein
MDTGKFAIGHLEENQEKVLTPNQSSAAME